ncbi:unnamed protein product [Effrenium voratum]|uniref:Uncharacterized protein n=1 Tax=Effrenium voratum TaxID=2562239 RepID=A0AA36HMA9_9DINO|nr:unnamed protein product [Effrenium voratum]
MVGHPRARGPHGLLPGRHQLHAVHPALSMEPRSARGFWVGFFKSPGCQQ